MKAYELLSDKSKWTKGWYAKDKSQLDTVATAEAATCWCVMGALQKCYNDKQSYSDALKRLNAIVKAPSLTEWNDRDYRTHGEVIDALKKANV